jgi:hypothetical protein
MLLKVKLEELGLLVVYFKWEILQYFEIIILF